MSFGKDYSYFLFDSQDRPLGANQFSKASSFDVYYGDTFKQGLYFKSAFGSGYIPSVLKREFVQVVIEELDKKRIKRNKQSAKQRQERKEELETLAYLPDRADLIPPDEELGYVLFDSQGRIIPKENLSKANFFSTFYQGDLKEHKIRLVASWSTKKKAEAILSRLASLLPIELDNRRRYTCRTEDPKRVVSKDGTAKIVQKRKCLYRDKSVLKLDRQKPSEVRKSLKKVKSDLVEAFEVFMEQTKNTTQKYIFRLNTPYYDENGEIIKEFKSDKTEDRHKDKMEDGKRVDQIHSEFDMGFGNSRTRITNMEYAERIIERMLFGDERVTKQNFENRYENYMIWSGAETVHIIGFSMEVVVSE